MKKRQKKNTPYAGQPSRSAGGVPEARPNAVAPIPVLPAAPVSSSMAIVPVNAGSYSREAYVARKPKKHRGLKIALAVVLVLLLAVGGVAFGGIMYVNSISDKLHQDVDEDLMQVLSAEQAAPGEPFYMLVMGVDRSEERLTQGDMDTFRSDSMILTRVDPVQKSVSLVSIERDTYVNIEGYGPDKINASAALGGSALVVDTISKFAGVPISHYVEIDFDGFKAAVDALGGIEVDVPITIDDEMAGGRVEAGPQTLNGDQALILCRSRHAYDEYGSGDYYRMANQRMVMGAIAKKILSSDVVTMANTINAMADYITTDMDVQTIIEVATDMRGMNADEDIYSAMNPTIPAQVGGIWYEYCDLAAWQTMMGRVDAGLPPYADDRRNLNDGGTLDGTITGVQEYATLPDGSVVPADPNAVSETPDATYQSPDAAGVGYAAPVL
ncbi:MAG: LCP family protein [Slackia sp.]|nr:LCP family protein [Slackia sp.]